VDTAALVLDLANARPPTLGSGRLVCVDGPGGSGKTTLAGALAERQPGTTVVHMDDLYDGWSGLLDVSGPLDAILLPLARGEAGSYRRYDWYERRYAETVVVAPGPLLVLEGVASGVRSHAHLATVTVWVTAPAELRLRRALERDGVALREQWHEWMRNEDVLFARERVAERADVLVDGSGVGPPTLRPPRGRP
jgi:uridine kinase